MQVRRENPPASLGVPARALGTGPPTGKYQRTVGKASRRQIGATWRCICRLAKLYKPRKNRDRFFLKASFVRIFQTFIKNGLFFLKKLIKKTMS